MAKIGSYGEIVFEVSRKKVQTFYDYQSSVSSRWNEHEIIQKKPKSEFVGPGLEEISFSVKFSASLGVNPTKQLEKLRAMVNSGKVAAIILGGKPISQNYYSLQRFDESNHVIDNKGRLLAVDVTLNLKEYALSKKKKKVTPKTMTKSGQTTSSKNKKSLGRMTITVKSVHIRSGPSTTAKVIGYAFKGDTLTVLSEKNGWYSLGQGKYITSNDAYSSLKKG